jgi:hypothetical protein
MDIGTTDTRLMLAMLTKLSEETTFLKNKSSYLLMMISLTILKTHSLANFSTSQMEMMFTQDAKLTIVELMSTHLFSLL